MRARSARPVPARSKLIAQVTRASRGALKTSRTGASPPNNPVTNPAQMQMRVMLPGKANTAVHLDVELGIACIGRKRQGRSDRGGQPATPSLLPHAASVFRSDAPTRRPPACSRSDLHRETWRWYGQCHLGMGHGAVHAVAAHRRPRRPAMCAGQSRFIRTKQDVVGRDAHVVQARAATPPGRIKVFPAHQPRRPCGRVPNANTSSPAAAATARAGPAPHRRQPSVACPDYPVPHPPSEFRQSAPAAAVPLVISTFGDHHEAF